VAVAQPLLDAAGVVRDAGVIELGGAGAVDAFIATAKRGRVWTRER
jgi:hypothetical protein